MAPMIRDSQPFVATDNHRTPQYARTSLSASHGRSDSDTSGRIGNNLRQGDASVGVLIVDDDPVTREIYSTVLDSLGYDCTTSDSAFSAVQKIHELKPQLVLLDIEMPDLRGDRIIGIIRDSSGSRAPSFILHSSNSDQELQRTCEATSALGYISKSANIELFVRAFKVLAERHKFSSNPDATRSGTKEPRIAQ